MSKKAKRIKTESSGALQDNPFSGLEASGLPDQPAAGSASAMARPEKDQKKRGRVEIRREKAGRGGKVVTVISGPAFANHCPVELERMTKDLKNRCASGGALKHKTIEIQGDQRDAARAFFEREHYRVVFTGG